ncbi:hypothetical protein GCM10023238_11950 [Streptomyces heliomycini]
MWLAVGLAGAAVDRPRRGAWLRGTALTAGAHVAGSLVKRVVRRPRPTHVEPLVGTVGRHSFPSSHATSSAAAAVAFGALGARAVPPARRRRLRLPPGGRRPLPVGRGGRRRPRRAHRPPRRPLDDGRPRVTLLRERPDRRQTAPSGTGGLLTGLLLTARPKQWVKNVLVIAAPAAAGELFSVHALTRFALVFVLFTACAAAVYLVNDARDADADRPTPSSAAARSPPAGSRCRPPTPPGPPSASSRPPSRSGCAPPEAAALLTAYLVMQLAYCVSLKHVLVVDLTVVTTGFVMRAVIGGLALGIPLSRWFLITTGFGALFMVAAKRYSEAVQTAGKRAPPARCSPSTPPATSASSGSSPPASPSSATACGPWRRAACRTPACCPGGSCPWSPSSSPSSGTPSSPTAVPPRTRGRGAGRPRARRHRPGLGGDVRPGGGRLVRNRPLRRRSRGPGFGVPDMGLPRGGQGRVMDWLKRLPVVGPWAARLMLTHACGRTSVWTGCTGHGWPPR